MGESGAGTFTQSGGTNQVSYDGNYNAGGLWIATNPGSSGAYQLSGDGQLSAFYEFVGCGYRHLHPVRRNQPDHLEPYLRR